MKELQKIAQIDNDDATTTIRYQLSDHLGSASLELDENADIISYEEYYPFGTSSFRSGRSESEVSQKRYKYVMKELDNETGMYYYGMRYYASWLCRFISVDPLQHKYPYYTPFQYAGNKPITFIDLDGAEPAQNNLFFDIDYKIENRKVKDLKINGILNYTMYLYSDHLSVDDMEITKLIIEDAVNEYFKDLKLPVGISFFDENDNFVKSTSTYMNVDFNFNIQILDDSNSAKEQFDKNIGGEYFFYVLPGFEQAGYGGGGNGGVLHQMSDGWVYVEEMLHTLGGGHYLGYDPNANFILYKGWNDDRLQNGGTIDGVDITCAMENFDTISKVVDLSKILNTTDLDIRKIINGKSSAGQSYETRIGAPRFDSSDKLFTGDYEWSDVSRVQPLHKNYQDHK